VSQPPVPTADNSLQLSNLHELHDSVMSGHPGIAVTMDAVRRRFYWPGMTVDIRRYVASCDVCQRTKPSQQAKMGLLQSLPVPQRPWQQVTMDLITQLPRTRRGHDAIVVFVCKLTKMVHYFPCDTSITAKRLARGFFHEVVRLHGVPESIVSDRDPRFTASFWQSLWRMFGTKLPMSTSYHPQTDGQTERANRTLETAIRAYVADEQDNWDLTLDPLEMAQNDSLHASTGYSPFYLNYGRHPSMPIDEYLSQVATIGGQTDAVRFASDLHITLSKARNNIAVALERQAHYANKKRRDVSFEVGDKVLLSTEHLDFSGRHGSRKLRFKFVGPFAISRRIGANAYELILPPTMKVHPVFNIDRLKLAKDPREHFPNRSTLHSEQPAITVDDGGTEWEVERILGRRGTAKAPQYLIKWTGWDNSHNSWEPASNLGGTEELRDNYDRNHDKLDHESRRLQGL